MPIDPAPSRSRTSQFLTHQGRQLAYSVEGKGPPVLLIQGAGVGGSAWAPQVQELARNYQCFTFDNPGIGQSQSMGKDLSIEGMAEGAVALLDAHACDSAHLIGHSMGGLIALALAFRQPARIRSLALLCTFANGRDATRFSWWSLWLAVRNRLGTRRARRRAFMEMILPPDYLRRSDREQVADQLATLFGHDLACQPTIVFRQLGAMRRYDTTARLAELASIPTLVLSAEQDRIAPPALGRALSPSDSGARYVEIPAAAHAVTIQLPGIVNEHLRDILPGRKQARPGRPAPSLLLDQLKDSDIRARQRRLVDQRDMTSSDQNRVRRFRPRTSHCFA